MDPATLEVPEVKESLQFQGRDRRVGQRGTVLMKDYGFPSVACLLLCGACIGPQQVLQPAPGAKQATEFRAAVMDDDEGIRGIAQVEAWRGDVILRDAATPIKVILDNQSPRTVMVGLENFELLGASGRLYRALEPMNISGSAPRPVPEPGYIPRGSSAGYSIHDAPYGHSPEYPTIHASTPPYPPYTGQTAMQHGRFETVPLPTAEMLRSAMLEGSLESGAQGVGFVYFEPLAEDERSVTLRIELPAAAGEQVARLRFPFIVEG